MTRAIHRFTAGRGRKLAAGLVAVLAAIATAVIPSTAAGAAGLATAGHVCKDIGFEGGVHGIFCTDLEYEPITNGVRFYAVTEGYCQNASGYVQCGDNVVWNGIYYSDSGRTNGAMTHSGCGPTNIYPAECSGSGRNGFYAAGHLDVPRGADTEIWAITFGDPNIRPPDCCQSSIALPGTRLRLNGNLETGHVRVNP